MSEQKPVHLYNTLSRKVEPLAPIEPGRIKLYCCGPTVYNYQHIGNLRTYVFEDLLVRTLQYSGFDVQHVMNITDVGHLVSDADEGEDKMLVAMKREGKRSEEIAKYYTKIFFDHCKLLNIKRPTVICKATEHIEEMINLIKRLEERGIAYLSGGNVYYDVSKFPSYGALAKLDLEGLQAGARIDVDDKKRNPLDFALWFTKSKFENQELQWDSPWGRGYPGWHIECSAMSMKYLGEAFDIHCGGIDHIPVHHTNEIAQSEGATGKQFARVWMHGAFLVNKEGKMSKSKGAFLTLDTLVEKGYDPLAYRLFCLGTSYRSELAFSWDAISGAQNSLDKIKASVLKLKTEVDTTSKETVTDGDSIEQFETAVLSDLNMPKALAVLHSVLGDNNLPASTKLATLYKFDEVLGLGMENWQAEVVHIPPEVHKLAEERENARKARDFASADALRDKIIELGFSIEDSQAGPIITKR